MLYIEQKLPLLFLAIIFIIIIIIIESNVKIKIITEYRFYEFNWNLLN